MIKVVIESPYRGKDSNETDKYVEYAKRCVRDSLQRNEAPIASHLLYTQIGILNDNNDEERKLGIEAGLKWVDISDKHVFYLDYGLSNGMRKGLELSLEKNIHIEFRYIL